MVVSIASDSPSREQSLSSVTLRVQSIRRSVRRRDGRWQAPRSFLSLDMRAFMPGLPLTPRSAASVAAEVVADMLNEGHILTEADHVETATSGAIRGAFTHHIDTTPLRYVADPPPHDLQLVYALAFLKGFGLRRECSPPALHPLSHITLSTLGFMFPSQGLKDIPAHRAWSFSLYLGETGQLLEHLGQWKLPPLVGYQHASSQERIFDMCVPEEAGVIRPDVHSLDFFLNWALRMVALRSACSEATKTRAADQLDYCLSQWSYLAVVERRFLELLHAAALEDIDRRFPRRKQRSLNHLSALSAIDALSHPSRVSSSAYLADLTRKLHLIFTGKDSTHASLADLIGAGWVDPVHPVLHTRPTLWDISQKERRAERPPGNRHSLVLH